MTEIQASTPRVVLQLDPTQPMAIVGLHARFLEVNHPLSTLLGYTADWLLNHALDDLIYIFDLEADRVARDELIIGLHSSASEHRRLVAADGTLIGVTHSIELQRDEHGMPLYFVSRLMPS